MLIPQRAISWRRKWLRWQRQLHRFKPLLVAVSLGLVLVFILYKTVFSSHIIDQELSTRSEITPKLRPVPVTTTKNVEQKRNPKPAIAPIAEITAIVPQYHQTSAPALPDSENLSIGQKRQAVRSAVLHAWSGYKEDAFGHDELLPLSHSFADNWGSLAWTLIDSVGTLFICGLMDEYNIARDFIANIRFDEIHSDVSVFETTIRILGGLLSAFDLSGDSMFIEQAKTVGDALLPAFSTASGFPSAKVNLATGRQSGAWLGMDTVILSEIGSLQMELSTLSHLTDDPKYMKAALKVYESLRKNTPGGLLPTQFSLGSGLPLNKFVSVGAFSDSYYEYLLKLYILSDRTATVALDMYLKAVDEILEMLVVEWTDLQTKKRRARIVQRDGDSINETMEHLTCFIPGMLALGAYYGERHNIEELLKRKDRHMELAVSLMDTCTSMYSMTSTQLSGEYIEFAGDEFRLGNDPRYLLRPETVESLFILYRITKKESYRDAGWHIFSAIEKHCKTDTAYAAVENVNSADYPAPKLNNMESFVMAETFKYLYLLFSPETLIPLEHFVFTTEAHPLRIMKGSKIQFSADF